MRQDATRRVTLQDIARQTGYSVNTVSHAPRNKDDIAPRTREAIQNVAREMGYAPNQIASSLRSGRTQVLLKLMPPVISMRTSPVMPAILPGTYGIQSHPAADR